MSSIPSIAAGVGVASAVAAGGLRAATTPRFPEPRGPYKELGARWLRVPGGVNCQVLSSFNYKTPTQDVETLAGFCLGGMPVGRRVC